MTATQTIPVPGRAADRSEEIPTLSLQGLLREGSGQLTSPLFPFWKHPGVGPDLGEEIKLSEDFRIPCIACESRDQAKETVGLMKSRSFK